MAKAERTHRMTLNLHVDAAAGLLKLHGELKAQAARDGKKAPKVGDVFSDVLRAGLKELQRKRR